jgi:citrate lyase synthetase
MLKSNLRFQKERKVPLVWSHSIDDLDWDELSALYQAAPLGNKNPLDLKTAFTNSMYVCFVFEGDKLVGVGRALADGVDCSYICDVALLPSNQGLGLGNQIVSTLVSLSRNHKKIILYSVPGKELFYKKLGFKRMCTAMAIFDNQNVALARGYVDES